LTQERDLVIAWLFLSCGYRATVGRANADILTRKNEKLVAAIEAHQLTPSASSRSTIRWLHDDRPNHI